MLDVKAAEDAMAADPDATLALLAEMSRATDEKLRALARSLAGRIVLDRVRTGPPKARGIGKLRSVPADRGGDLDLDASMSAVVDARALRTSAASRRPHLAHLVQARTGALSAGRRLRLDGRRAAGRGRADRGGLRVAGARGVRGAVLRPRGLACSRRSTRPSRRSTVVDAVLGLRGHGVTALASALRAAGEQLERSRAARRVVVLLSDCRATDDEDPVPVAARVPELVILAPAEGCEQAADLAARAGARWAPMAGSSDAPAALLCLLER